MAPIKRSLTVIKQYEVKDAPTGEATRYITEDGAIWKLCFNIPKEWGTGDRYGKIIR